MQSSTAVPNANSSSAAATAASRASRPSDDEILGLTPDVTAASSTGSAQPADAGAADSQAPPVDPEQFRAIFDANPSLRDAWRESQAFREIFPDLESAREIQKFFPTADDARAARTQIGDLAKLDALFFSNRPESHAELAAAVYRLNPAAFRSLARMMQSISAGEPSSTGPAGAPAATRAAANSDGSIASDAFSAGPDTTIPAAQQAFLHEANAAAVTGVIDAIHSQVDRLLPSGTADGAKRRIVGEIYREIDASLRANPAYVQQLRQAVRAGSSSPENRQAIAGMVMARARQALPAIAKRVINEWTSGVVAQSNARIDRQRSAERRVDIAGGSPGGDGPRALMPRDLDYRRLSDADILNM
jgi:hypothetical protein